MDYYCSKIFRKALRLHWSRKCLSAEVFHISLPYRRQVCGSSTVSNILRFSLAFVLRASRPFLAITALYPEFFDLCLKCRQCKDAVRCCRMCVYMYMYVCKRRVYSPLHDAVYIHIDLFQGRR